jgi:DMSO reductase anchor subunit
VEHTTREPLPAAALQGRQSARGDAVNPAWSVVVFTVLAGFGQGLAVCLAAAVLFGGLSCSGPYLADALAVAMALLIAGLAASFLHLGRPMRAWRAAAMWRTSWLSREVIVMPATIGVLALWWLALVTHRAGDAANAMLAALTIILCLALWVCTAMIYASIRFIAEWAHPLTLASYLSIGLSSGLVLFVALAGFWGERSLSASGAPLAIAATVAAVSIRWVSLRRNAALRPRSTLQSATGIRAERLVQKSMGTSARSANLREFFHRAGDVAVQRIERFALAFGFAVPLALAILGWGTGTTFPWLLAAMVQGVGLLGERWLFFAQARHPQNLYYQRVA